MSMCLISWTIRRCCSILMTSHGSATPADVWNGKVELNEVRYGAIAHTLSREYDAPLSHILSRDNKDGKAISVVAHHYSICYEVLTCLYLFNVCLVSHF